jgi:hypothetical protein
VRWATVALSSIVMLIVGFGVITGVEALLGRPLSAIGGDGGGTTLSRIVDHSNGGSGASRSTPSDGGPTDGGATQPATTAPTDSPTTDAPTTEQPTPTEPTPTEPTQPSGTAPTPTQPAGGGATAAP